MGQLRDAVCLVGLSPLRSLRRLSLSLDWPTDVLPEMSHHRDREELDENHDYFDAGASFAKRRNPSASAPLVIRLFSRSTELGSVAMTDMRLAYRVAEASAMVGLSEREGWRRIAAGDWPSVKCGRVTLVTA